MSKIQGDAAVLAREAAESNKDIMKNIRKRRARLELADGSVFEGWSFGADRSAAGEVVFQTGMVGYEQTLSDPSYCQQIVVFTYPLVGNYGVPSSSERDSAGLPLYFESARIYAAGLVVLNYEESYSHWLASRSLGRWLEEEGIPGIYGIDTRRLTQKIREHGSMLGRIILDGEDQRNVPFVDPNCFNLVAQVSCQNEYVYGPSDARFHVLALDCGLKYNQLRCLAQRKCRVTVVPWNANIFADQFRSCDGLFISNGPGDPTMVPETIHHVRQWLAEERPVFGICLGHQLLALAAGAQTYKLKYGNRGHNQPCVDERTGRCYITSQNHGYAVDPKTLPVGWEPFFTNANDGSNEGIIHASKPAFSVQFHPEACAGPCDTAFLFDLFVEMMQTKRPPGVQRPPLDRRFVPDRPIRKVLVLGSGGLSIGQAGEFDYSGSQAIKALKEEGIYTVLINPNIATVQTTRGLADKVYFLPIDPDSVMKVAENELPDGVLLQFGGQTALNCGIELHKRHFFQDKGIRVLGTSVETIMDTEDRERFNARLAEIGEPFAQSASACSVEQAVQEAERIGYPVIARAAFALGGLGSGFANNAAELTNLARKAFSCSPQVLVERSMKGWKEIEYEVVRDAFDNCITVCNMENFDPLGVHTGESIVVAPSQTLSDAEYQMLRNSAIKTVRHLGVVGECNIQFALNPTSREYCIIEVNARLSRSSALASKATGYPLAFVAAKLALGKALPAIRNSITQETTACFEPSLDYIVVKMPRWDLKKFERVNPHLGSSMKSVGEVMAIGRTFEETIQKAIRMVRDYYVNGFEGGIEPYSDEEMQTPTEARILAIASGFASGRSVDEIHAQSQIDRWFLQRLAHITEFEQHLTRLGTMHVATGSDNWLTAELLWRAKQLGFSDRQIGRLVGNTELEIRKLRKEFGVLPNVKQIDTVAAEFPAKTNYLYMTYAGGQAIHDVSERAGGTVVLGSGAYRIGSSVEFDWCAVSAIRTLRNQGTHSIMINYNPETVSTDYDECDRLYFEELSFERVLDICEREAVDGVIVSMGGQIPNNIAMSLHRQGVHILGTTPEMIDSAENRYKFSRMLDRIGVDQPQWKELTSIADAAAFCTSVGYPCLVRPSYVLSGAAMNVAYKEEDLERYLTEAAQVSREHPVVISKFILEAKEIDVDAVARRGELVVHFISEHVENAGVHSGDATLVLPAQDLEPETVRKLEDATRRIANALNVTGPMNIQFIAKNNEIKVIECNIRASRSFPFVSKTMGLDLAKVATKVMLGQSVQPYPVEVSRLPHVGVKVAMFSFARLLGADPILGVEMASTGEVACFGESREEAYLKGLRAAGIRLPQRNICISIGSYKEKLEFLESAKKLAAVGYRLYATPGTADFLVEHNVPCTLVVWPSDEYQQGTLDITRLIQEKMIDFFINLPSQNKLRRVATFMSNGYISRRAAVDFSIPLLTNIKCAKLLVRALARYGRGVSLPLQAYDVRFSARVITLPGLVSIYASPTTLDSLDNATDTATTKELLMNGRQHHKLGSSSLLAPWDQVDQQLLRGGFVAWVAAAPTAMVSDVEALRAVRGQLAQQARCDYAVYAYATATNAAILPGVANEVAGLFISLPREENLSRITAGTEARDGPQTPPTSGTMKDSLAPWLRHLELWPRHKPVILHTGSTQTLSAMLFGAVLYARPLHVHGVRRRDDMALICTAKERGIPVTCDVLVEDLCGDAAQRGLEQADIDALWEAADAIDGVTGSPRLALGLLLEAVQRGRISMAWLSSRLVEFPRRFLGLSPADHSPRADTYVEVDIDQTERLPLSGDAASNGEYRLRGRVLRVVLRQQIAYLDDKVLLEPGAGHDLLESAIETSSGDDSGVMLSSVGTVPQPVDRVAHQVSIPPTKVIPAMLPVTQRARGATATIMELSREAASSEDPLEDVDRARAAVEHRARQLDLMTLSSVPVANRQWLPSSKTSQREILEPRPLDSFSAVSLELPLLRRSWQAASPQPGWSQALSMTTTSPGPNVPNSAPASDRLRHQNVLSVSQFTRAELHTLFGVAQEMRQMVNRMGMLDLLRGRVLALIFYEPSTRTSCSFAAAMQRLGGTVIQMTDTQTSSVAKGESLADTVRTMASYADIIVLRHPEAGAAERAARALSKTPLINAGDGTGEHPTQALLDVFTIREELGTVNSLVITFVGDLRHGRTVHSLARLLALYQVRINYVSPRELRTPSHVLEDVASRGVEQREYTNLDDCIAETDVLYMTRLQRERFTDPNDYERFQSCYIVTPRTLTRAKDTMIVMHPLPRVNEIAPEVDSDPRAVYFRQMEYGMYVRMALLAMVLGRS
jgi:aspartate carbamoyltransferase